MSESSADEAQRGCAVAGASFVLSKANHSALASLVATQPRLLLVHLTRNVIDASPLIFVIVGVLALAVQRFRAAQPAGESERVLPIQDSYSRR